MMIERDVAVELAKNIANVNYSDLPAEALEIVKKDILDTVGITIAGSTADGAREVVELGREFGGREDSTLIAYGDKLPVHMASFINSVMAHALDFDDNHDKGMLHVGSAVVPPAFAMAQRLGRKVNGKELITAVALGIDLSCRMAVATKLPIWTSGWMLTSLYGYFGSMAATAKLLGLNDSQIVDAFGISYAQMAGNLQVITDDESALTKRLQVGFSAKGGVMSALLAQKGLTGAQKSLEGRFGLYNLYHQGEYNRDALTKDLGKHFGFIDLGFKPYPCCRPNHPYIDAALQLYRDHHLSPDDIKEIVPIVNRFPHPFCHPLEVKRRPTDIIPAQFSLPYALAVGLLRGKVVVNDFTREALKDEAVFALAEKVTPKLDDSLDIREIPPARIELILKDGRTISSDTVLFAKGNPKNPMTMDDLSEKFRDCASHSVNPLPKENIEEVISKLRNLEDVTDVNEIIQLVVPVGK
ncbi:MmgE/PrpD family protein [Chloroflexota bacterium]